jgi:hypothetical protein
LRSENRVFRRIFGLIEGETGGRLEKLHNLKASPNIITVMKSRIMAWARHAARMGS